MAVNETPTKSNLLSAKESLEFSKKGYELLDRKRNVLIREMMQLIDDAKEIQEKINSIFPEAYEALKVANMTEGIDTVEDIALAIEEAKDFEVLLKSVMGVEVPSVKYEKRDQKPSYSFYRTNNAFDRAVKSFQDVKYLVYELAEIENSVYRLAMEVKKTQKRTNALQNIQIPKFTSLTKHIQDALDEREREDFFRLKMVKRRTARSRE
ncbi:V-type ATP synthase subunit D [Oxobacter pfennigii]|uniref:V-type ATP synthase subunit D n=1 Tax=Oxobacter pfennigii TaxID=36849 RepID=A0A0P8WZ86_9CLOT|nr:V-type ATP synthase subunit D [Oxobacter pfennigii]KPU43789.1 V-type ATP synthase subunit D [Oxobacter pfennigii]